MPTKKSSAGPSPITKVDAPEPRALRVPQNHRTVDRVTRILEEVVYRPGMTFAELARALDAAKSSVHGFISGLLAKGWLYEVDRRYYLGPAVYGLTLASGHIRAGLVTHEDLVALSQETKLTVFLGVQAGDHLIYVDEAGADDVAGYETRSNIRRTLLVTAGGKALLAAQPSVKREAYLLRRGPEEREHVEALLNELKEILSSRVAKNVRLSGARFALGAAVKNQAGEPVAAVTLVGPTSEVEPRVARLSKILLKHIDTWTQRSSRNAREAI